MISVVFAGLLAVASASSEKKIVCYYADWTVYRPGNGKFEISNVDSTLCTHIIYAFVLPKDDGSINIGEGAKNFNQFAQLRQQNPSVKLMVAIGGWNEHSARFTKIAASPSLRSTFAQNVLDLLVKYKLDGLDVDWEYPAQHGGVPADKQNFPELLKDLKVKLAPQGLLLSAAVAVGQWSAEQSYDIAQMSKYLDFINLMAYDMHGSWETKTGIHAPLYAATWENGQNLNIDSAVRYWTQQGAPVDKLVLGAPFYGRGFTLASGSNKPGSPAAGVSQPGPYTRESGMLGYNEICEKIKNEKWKVEFENEQMVPYAFKGNQWVGYDDERSFAEKANYVNTNGLGGIMVWSLDDDDFRGNCGSVKYPLLKTINAVLRNGAGSSYLPPSKNSNNNVSNFLKGSEATKSNKYNESITLEGQESYGKLQYFSNTASDFVKKLLASRNNSVPLYENVNNNHISNSSDGASEPKGSFEYNESVTNQKPSVQKFSEKPQGFSNVVSNFAKKFLASRTSYS